MSLSKSISIFHASLGENARLAREVGDQAGDAYWSGLVAEVDAMIWQATWAGFGYFQREAGYTRTGSHHTRVNGRETGQWHEADLAVAHWLQHTSRDGDMQLHVHSQIAHTARTTTDGKWRAPDSLGYNEHIGAVAAITAQHLEEALTRRFGVQWVARDDGHGFEIKGISGQMMRLFSSRRESITADVRARAARFEQRYGRAPSQRELAQLAQASNFSHAQGEGRRAGLRAAARRDGRTSSRARSASRWRRSPRRCGTPTRPQPTPADRTRRRLVPGELEMSRAAQKAVALAQQEKSTWTRADLIKYLGRVLPRTGMAPAAAGALLEDLADRALRSEFEPVLCLEAPEAVEVPRSLLRADGRSVYQRHGGVRYATRAQLAMEERMLAQARADGAPRLTRADAARALGADPARLEHALYGSARDTPNERTASGLREDQAAAVLSVLTDGKRVSVINAPAGSGKTHVLAEAGRAWEAAGLGPVIGITASQSARNTLAAGVPVSYNTAQFLGHLPGQRGARGPLPIAPGTLLSVDETSMISGPELADLISLAEATGSKVILAGDTAQLQAVENGGGMALLASRLGYVQLAEPVRFRAGWEQAASLRLRAGDVSVLAEYDQHGRIRGGEPEQIMDAAAAAYVALTVDGTDTLLMAADHALRRELSRRIRDDLIRLGIVRPGPAVPIADGAAASPGDLIVCTRNDHAVEAGEPGRTLANGDLLRIDAVTDDGLLVRRALDADPETGQRRWTDRHFLYASYETAELGYAVTDHAAQGRTVHTGLAVICGTEDRQHAYVALTRGTDANTAYVFTLSPKLADPAPGPRPAPELARYDQHATGPAAGPDPAAEPAGTRDALAVLADVLERDGQQLSATQTWQQALADADHLAILHAHLGRRNQPRPRAALPGPAAGGPAAGIPARTGSPGEMAVADDARRRTRRPGPHPGAGRCDRRAGPDRGPRRDRRHRRPAPPLDRRPHPAAGRAGGPRSSPTSPTPNAAATPPRSPRRWTPARTASASTPPTMLFPGRSAPSARSRNIPSTGWSGSSGPPRSAPGGNYPATPTPPTRSAPNPPPRPGPAGRLARGAGGARPRRRPRRPRPARRDAAAPARHLPHRNRLGTAMDRRGTAPGPARRRRSPPRCYPRHRRSRHRPPLRPARKSRPAAGAGGQLPGHARRLPRTRGRVRRGHGRPAAVGAGHPPAAAAGGRRRRRTAPPAPRPAVPAAALRRTRARHPRATATSSP